MNRNTRERLLDHAERLFAERGIASSSVRDIVERAGANLGAITYHFGTKQALTRAVIDRRLEPLNEERSRLLEQAERARAPRPPRLEDVLHAAIFPTIELMRRHPHFMRIVGRLLCDPSDRIRRHVEAKPLFRRFLRAIASAAPHLPPMELAWRVHFVRGALLGTWTASDSLRSGRGNGASRDGDGLVARRLIEFAAAGLRAPVGPRQGADRSTHPAGRAGR